jgi:hypothetical protein
MSVRIATATEHVVTHSPGRARHAFLATEGAWQICQSCAALRDRRTMAASSRTKRHNRSLENLHLHWFAELTV